MLFGFESHTTLKEGWASKNWSFELLCWRRLLRVPWTARSNQSILKEINPEYSLEGLMMKLKLQYFGKLDEKSRLIRKDPDVGKDWRQKGEESNWGWDGWMASPTQWTWVWVNSRRQRRTRKPGGAAVYGVTKVGHNLATQQENQHIPHSNCGEFIV